MNSWTHCSFRNLNGFPVEEIYKGFPFFPLGYSLNLELNTAFELTVFPIPW